MPHAEDIARRYVHIWNETDPAARRAQLAGLWIEDGTHYVREREVRGHADLETRVATSHQTNVTERNYKFEVAGGVEQLRGHGQVQLAHGPEKRRRDRRDRLDRAGAGGRRPYSN